MSKCLKSLFFCKYLQKLYRLQINYICKYILFLNYNSTGIIEGPKIVNKIKI